jgi:hypothetical protein
VKSTMWTDWLPIAIIVVLLGVADVAVCPLMKAIRPQDVLSVIVYSSFGMILAQAGLLTCGLVFARGHFGLRMLVHWFLAAVLVSLWAVGLIASESRHVSRVGSEFWTALCSLPALSLGLQLPLWGARCGLGWNWDTTAARETSAWRMSISELFIATAVVAGTLAVSRLSPDSENQWVTVGLFAAGGIGASLIGVVPLVGIFQLRWPLWTRWGIALGTAFVLTSISLVIPASGLFRINLQLQAVIGLYAVVFWYVVTVCAGLTLVEWRREFERRV